MEVFIFTIFCTVHKKKYFLITNMTYLKTKKIPFRLEYLGPDHLIVNLQLLYHVKTVTIFNPNPLC
jgi:hypothetical protein